MDLFKNIIVNLKATGPAAVLIVWLLGITALGIFGNNTAGYTALGIMAGTGGLLLRVLGTRA